MEFHLFLGAHILWAGLLIIVIIVNIVIDSDVSIAVTCIMIVVIVMQTVKQPHLLTH